MAKRKLNPEVQTRKIKKEMAKNEKWEKQTDARNLRVQQGKARKGDLYPAMDHLRSNREVRMRGHRATRRDFKSEEQFQKYKTWEKEDKEKKNGNGK